MKRIALLIMLLMCITLVSAQDYETVLEESFEDDSNWELFGGTWSVGEGAFVGTSGAATSADSDGQAILKDTVLSDFTFEADMTRVSDVKNRGEWGLAFRTDGNTRGYWVQFTHGKTIDLYRFDEGWKSDTIELIKSKTVKASDVAIDTTHTLKVQADGPTITVSLNGEELFSKDDDTYLSGQVGLKAANDVEVSFENVVVAKKEGSKVVGTVKSSGSNGASFLTSWWFITIIVVLVILIALGATFYILGGKLKGTFKRSESVDHAISAKLDELDKKEKKSAHKKADKKEEEHTVALESEEDADDDEHKPHITVEEEKELEAALHTFTFGEAEPEEEKPQKEEEPEEEVQEISFEEDSGEATFTSLQDTNEELKKELAKLKKEKKELEKKVKSAPEKKKPTTRRRKVVKKKK